MHKEKVTDVLIRSFQKFIGRADFIQPLQRTELTLVSVILLQTQYMCVCVCVCIHLCTSKHSEDAVLLYPVPVSSNGKETAQVRRTWSLTCTLGYSCWYMTVRTGVAPALCNYSIEMSMRSLAAKPLYRVFMALLWRMKAQGGEEFLPPKNTAVC